MSNIESYGCRKEKWYNRTIFPLIPVVDFRKADQHNTTSLSFRWLVLTFWTLDGFEFEISLVANTHWGIGVIGILPYLRWRLTIPCPAGLGMWIDTKLTRQTKHRKDKR